MAAKDRVTCREDLSKGDEVYIIVRMDREGQLVKRKKARVIDVLRKAAVLDIDGESEPRTVRFSELQLKRDPKPAPKPPKRLRAVKTPKAEAPPPKPEPEPEPAPVATPTLDDWVAQGVRVQEQLILRSHEIENAATELEEEYLQLQIQAESKKAEVEAKRSELAALRERIALLDTLRNGIA